MNHKGKRLFITGIPTSGKSHLANILAREVAGITVNLDSFRKDLSLDPKFNEFTDFYLNQNEMEYLTHTSPGKKWANLVTQSEGLWPAFLEIISRYEGEECPVIFECVNILPHLAKRDLYFPGVVIIGKSFEETLNRIKANPRWGATEELQRFEADTFFNIERPMYMKEAQVYGYPVFENSDDAIGYCLDIIR